MNWVSLKERLALAELANQFLILLKPRSEYRNSKGVTPSGMTETFEEPEFCRRLVPETPLSDVDRSSLEEPALAELSLERTRFFSIPEKEGALKARDSLPPEDAVSEGPVGFIRIVISPAGDGAAPGLGVITLCPLRGVVAVGGGGGAS